MRPELANYMTTKYAASRGGTIPEDEEIDEDVTDREPPDPVPVSPPGPVANMPDAMLDEPEGDDKADVEDDALSPKPHHSAPNDEGDLRNYLTSKYAEAADDKKIQSAREDRQKSDRILALGEGLEGIFRSKGQAYGGQGVNHASYDSARALAGQGVRDAEADRQSKIQTFLQQQALEQHATQVMATRGTIEQRRQAAQYIKDANTAGSAVSLKAAQDFNKLYPEYAVDPKTATAAHVETFAKQVAAKRNVDAKFDASETKKVIAQEAAGTRADAAAARADDKAEKADAKASKDQDTAYTEYRGKMSGGGKGVPANVKNALVAKTNIANAKDIVAKAGGADNMNENQVQLFMAEIAKIATNGVPTEATMHHLNPGTFQQNYNAFMSKVKGQPQPAEVGDFIRQNQKYLDGLEETTNSVIGDYRKDVHKGYKNRLSPRDLSEAETDYPEASGKAAAATVSAAPASPAEVASLPAHEDVLAELARRKAAKGSTYGSK